MTHQALPGSGRIPTVGLLLPNHGRPLLPDQLKDNGKEKAAGSLEMFSFACYVCAPCAGMQNADCPECLQRPLPSSLTTRGTARVETLWCPGPTDSGICGHPLGISDCPLCAAHKQFWQYQRNLNQKLVYPPAHFCKFLQLDRFLYSLDLAVEPTFQYQLQEVHQVLDGQTDSYTFEQWACHWIALATSPTDIQGFLPLPKSSKLPFELPDLLRSEPSLHNCGFTLMDNWLRENLLWLTFLQVQSQTGGITIKTDFISSWNLNVPDKVDIPTCNMIPWDSLVAALAGLCIQEAECIHDLHFWLVFGWLPFVVSSCG